MDRSDVRRDSLLRLNRLSRVMDLKPETMDLVKQVLFNSLGLISTTTKTKNHEITIRRLIEDGKPWEMIKPTLIDWLRTAPSSMLAAKAIELAYLSAGSSALLEILKLINNSAKGFWREVHPAVRVQLILEIKSEDDFKGVLRDLALNAMEVWLLPIERMVAFEYLIKSKNQARAYEVYTEFSKVIMKSCVDFGARTSIRKDWIFLSAAKSAIDCGQRDYAMRLLKNISPDDRLFQTASKYILFLEGHEKVHLKSDVVMQLMTPNSWSEKEIVFRNYLSMIRENTQGDFDIISIINTVLAKDTVVNLNDPFELSSYVKMCLDHLDLIDVVPNIINILKKNIFIFYQRPIDGAIWKNILTLDSDSLSKNWRAVAFVHQFVMGGSSYEESLFTAFEIYREGDGSDGFPAGLSFNLLKEAAIKALASCDEYSKEEKDLMNAQISLCKDDNKIKIVECEEYIKKIAKPRYQTIDRLLNISKAKGSPRLIQAVIGCLMRFSHMRNQDLHLLWEITNTYKNFDCAWRVATVLKTRRCLPKRVHHPWTVSGEMRKSYPFLQLSYDDMEFAFDGFDNQYSRLCLALLKVGYKVCDLIQYVDSSVNSSPYTIPPENSNEAMVLSAVKDLSILKLPQKKIGSGVNMFPGTSLPFFASSAAGTRWSTLVSIICETLGLTAINNDLRKLEKYTKIVSSAQSSCDAYKYGKPNKWFKSLTHAEHTAWADLTNIMRRVDLDNARNYLGKFVVRLCIMINPNHYEALISLQNMGVPLAILRDLETFIVSESYSQFRDGKEILSTTPIQRQII